jgi:hypothetical protein
LLHAFPEPRTLKPETFPLSLTDLSQPTLWHTVTICPDSGRESKIKDEVKLM